MRISRAQELIAELREAGPLNPEDQFPDDIKSGLLDLKDIELEEPEENAPYLRPN